MHNVVAQGRYEAEVAGLRAEVAAGEERHAGELVRYQRDIAAWEEQRQVWEDRQAHLLALRQELAVMETEVARGRQENAMDKVRLTIELNRIESNRTE